MTTEDLKDQLVSSFQKVSEMVQDTTLFQQFKERFDGLTPQAQKMSAFAAVIFVFLLILTLPYSMWSDSEALVSEFDERRQVTRELFKVAREVNETPNIPSAPEQGQMTDELTQRAKQGNLLDEQIKAIDSNAEVSGLIPTDKSSGSFQVSLTKLNVTQIVNIGTSLTNMNPSVKMTGLEIIADQKDPRYFNVTYKMTSLLVPNLSGQTSSGVLTE
jgi:hypothetical protein